MEAQKPELKAMARKCRSLADEIREASVRQELLEAATIFDRLADEEESVNGRAQLCQR